MEPGYQALRNSSAWIDYSARGKVRVSGEDAGRLLHAMTTADVKNLNVGSGLYTFFLSDRGRIQADANIFRLETEYWIDSEPETASFIHHHLDKFIIADDANTSDETNSWFSAAIEGPDSPVAVEHLGLPAALQPFSIVRNDFGVIARVATTGSVGFRIWVGEDQRLELFDRLKASGMPQATEEDVRTVRLENAIPRFGEDITERFLVQETRMLHAVSFTKGCYLGQEIVERIRSQGQVHRFLTPVRITGTKFPPAPGSKLVHDLDLKPAGELMSSAYSPTLEEIVGLAYIRAEVLNQNIEMQVSGADPAVKARLALAPAHDSHEALVR